MKSEYYFPCLDWNNRPFWVWKSLEQKAEFICYEGHSIPFNPVYRVGNSVINIKEEKGEMNVYSETQTQAKRDITRLVRTFKKNAKTEEELRNIRVIHEKEKIPQ